MQNTLVFRFLFPILKGNFYEICPSFPGQSGRPPGFNACFMALTSSTPQVPAL
jgi:hypothetical protein